MLALSFIVFLLCLLVVQLVRLQFQRRRYPPGPTPLPFIGCLWNPKFLRLNREHLTEGTIFIPNMASALYDANEWETPLTFNPNHFLDKEGNFTCREAFIPFSLGHRACLGENLAKTEMFLFFTNLVQTFNFHLANGSKDIKLDAIWGGTLHPHSFEIHAIPH